MRYVCVTWADATTWLETGWKDFATVVALKPDVGTFRGWLLHEEPDYLVFATHRMGEDDDVSWDGELCLPRGCIISMVDADGGNPGLPVGGYPGKRNARKGKGMGPRKRGRIRG